ncbi:MAG: methionyl-tRNA formyltransferase [Lachnospiraceae bacterium]|nr:methionyl-tRNA formyltransferase [Lachnospiraceae bacterium]
MDIVFMGTPDFAVPSLKALIESDKHNVKAVYTQPDKPVGRKKVLTPPIVKQIALSSGLPVLQPISFKDEQTLKELADLVPDVIVVIAYGRILPKSVLDMPKYGCINIHGSLLPKLRGAAPIQRAVLDGEEETGVTSMLMDVGVDTGDMLITETVKILPNETSGELFDRLAPIGAKVLLDTLEAVENGTVARTKQDDKKATHAAMLTKDEAVIDWSKSAQTVHNKVRGLNPWPVAVAEFKGKKLKIYNTKVRTESGTAGSVISVNPPIVACGEGSVELLDVQLEGKNRMSSADFFRGQRIQKGDIIS